MLWRITVRDGRITADTKGILNYIETRKDGEYTCEVEKYNECLSERQRKYYFGVVIPTCAKDEAWRGYGKTEIHETLKTLYLPDYEAFLAQFDDMGKPNIKDVMQRFLLLYHDLTIRTETKGTFERYLSRIRMGEAKKNGIRIRLPNESERWEGWEMMQCTRPSYP